MQVEHRIEPLGQLNLLGFGMMILWVDSMKLNYGYL
jgi:hypothetical protein